MVRLITDSTIFGRVHCPVTERNRPGLPHSDMNTRKKVSFGSKGSVVETWIINDSPPSVRPDARDVCLNNTDDKMTSSRLLAPNDKTTNHIPAATHHLDNQKTVVDENESESKNSNEDSPPEYFESELLCMTQPQGTTTTNTVSYNKDAASRILLIKVQGQSLTQLSHVPTLKEEYYNVLHPEPRDQSLDCSLPEIPGNKETDQLNIVISPEDGGKTLIIDSFTGWPLKRSSSLESRDNPFLPGGDLSREAEDLLSNATIIRDHFYLNPEEKKALQLMQQQQLQQEKEQQQQKASRSGKHVQIVDHLDRQEPASNGVVEERVLPTHAVSSLESAAPTAATRQNGKAAGESPLPPADAVDSVTVTIPETGAGQSISQADSGGPGGGGPSSLNVQDGDKKRRNKCCSVM